MRMIGITTNILKDGSGVFANYERAYVNRDYIEAVLSSGAVPVLLPINSNVNVLNALLEKVEGVVFSGGYDVSPLFYGEEPSAKLGEVLPERDRAEVLVYRICRERGLKMLGICRGMQFLNIANGGSLWQDLSEMEGVTGRLLKHAQAQTPNLPTHSVRISRESLLYKILREDEIFVNSFHHQAVSRLGEGLSVSAVAKDGVVEAVENVEQKTLCVQWHPEMMFRTDPNAKKIFDFFVKW